MPNERFMRHHYGASGYVGSKNNPHGTDGRCPWCASSDRITVELTREQWLRLLSKPYAWEERDAILAALEDHDV